MFGLMPYFLSSNPILENIIHEWGNETETDVLSIAKMSAHIEYYFNIFPDIYQFEYYYANVTMNNE